MRIILGGALYSENYGILFWCFNISGLQMFLSRNKNIKQLVLAMCTKLDDSAIICVAEALRNKLVCALLIFLWRHTSYVHDINAMFYNRGVSVAAVLYFLQLKGNKSNNFWPMNL